jgi:starvation-inducible DNA-binding protein
MHFRRSSPGAPGQSPFTLSDQLSPPHLASRLSGNLPGNLPRNLPGKVVTSFLQPLLVDLIALVLFGKQAQWHLHGRHVLAVREALERLVADVRVRTDDVAMRMAVHGACIDVRPATVATTTGVPDVPPGLFGDDKTMSALVDQIDAAIARARNALGPLGAVDPVSQAVVLGVVTSLEKSRWEFAAQVPAEPAPLRAEPTPLRAEPTPLPAEPTPSPAEKRQDRPGWPERPPPRRED